MQLGGHVLARIEAGLHLDDATREQLVHFFVRAGEHIAGALDQAFLEDEVRDGVVDHLADDIAQPCAIWRAAQLVESVDVIDDAAVLPVNLCNPGVQLGDPDQQCHDVLQKFRGFRRSIHEPVIGRIDADQAYSRLAGRRQSCAPRRDVTRSWRPRTRRPAWTA